MPWKHTLWIALAAVLLTIAPVNAQVTLPTPTPPDAFDADAIAEIDLSEPPVIPEWTDTAREIYAYGQTLDRDPAAVAKVGDSVTAAPEFLTPLATDEIDPGEYETIVTDVLDTIDANTFARDSMAASEGLLTVSVVDPMWAGDECNANESPLLCEYRLLNPAYALIMFGTNDVLALDAATFNMFLRDVVQQTGEAGVVPVLSTFPPRPEDVDKSLTFNRIIVQLATDYDLPLINLLAALEPLPDYGVDPDDTLHLTAPPAPLNPVTFTEEGLEYGYNVRNLVTLQTLHQLMTTLDDTDQN